MSGRKILSIGAIGAVVVVVLVFTLVVALRERGGPERQQPGAAGPPMPAPGGDRPPLPVGQKGGWEMAFSDEFEGNGVDPARWSDRSSAEGAGGQGNTGNQQLEWNQLANCTVSGGELVMTARRQAFNAPNGSRYDWTSCLMTTTPSYTFQFGYIEERAVLPAPKGFWPAFWTWQAPDVNKHVETDVYEFYSDNHGKLYMTQHSGKQDRCNWSPSFDPSAGWHTYGAAIEPSGTTWYVDGAQVCHTRSTADAPTNIITNLAVYSKIPPAAGTDSAVKRVDYVRAWQRPGGAAG
jgi:beta-glucanase (GH16 family)